MVLPLHAETSTLVTTQTFLVVTHQQLDIVFASFLLSSIPTHSIPMLPASFFSSFREDLFRGTKDEEA